MDWAQIVVILLAVLFITVLIVAVALLILLFRVSGQIKSAAKNTEKTLHTLEDSVTKKRFDRTTVPFAAGKLLMNQFKKRSGKGVEKSSNEPGDKS